MRRNNGLLNSRSESVMNSGITLFSPEGEQRSRLSQKNGTPNCIFSHALRTLPAAHKNGRFAVSEADSTSPRFSGEKALSF